MINAEQLSKFTLESIHPQELFSFDVAKVATEMEQHIGKLVIGADFGGDKGIAKLLSVDHGKMVVEPEFEQYVQGSEGAGYLDCLEQVAEYASAGGTPVGISWGSPLDGTRPIEHPKINLFSKELSRRYDGDLAKLFSTLGACINDGPAGLISAAISANSLSPVESVILPINGGGLGLAVLHNGKVYATEAGHVEGVQALNTYGQTKSCGVYGQDFICIETLGANKAGIEQQWKTKRPEMRAIDIEKEYVELGDQFALELYDHSALVVAHMVIGAANALKIELNSDKTAIMGHGGGFKFPGYSARVAQIIESYTESPVRFDVTHNFGDPASNACIDGAAIAALIDLNDQLYV